MSAIACNFALLSVFDARYDVTWSFQYSLCGNETSNGGFATFLFEGSTLTGGSSGAGLGYTSLNNSGVSGAILGIGFDSTGLFATTGIGYSTGVNQPSANTATLRIGDNFTYGDSTVLSFDVVESTEIFRTLRINLTDVGQTIHMHLYDEDTQTYNLIGSLSTGLIFVTETPVRVGISVATPVTGDQACIFQIKDLHYQGKSIG